VTCVLYPGYTDKDLQLMPVLVFILTQVCLGVTENTTSSIYRVMGFFSVKRKSWFWTICNTTSNPAKKGSNTEGKG